MSHRVLSWMFLAVFLGALAPSVGAQTDIDRLKFVSSCQKKIASAGARFAMKVIKETLKCTNAVSQCQLEFEAGVFGPQCDSNPPPLPPGCCDSDDRTSNSAFDACMTDADDVCATSDVKIANAEITKQEQITSSCTALTSEELCGSQGNGLNFATLNAGCLAINPQYQCTLPNLINCVGGPLERQLTDQISALLDGRAGDAVAALHLQAQFPGIPVPVKVKGQVAAGKQDVYSFTGQEGDEIRVRVITRDDNGNNTSNLQPALTFIGTDGQTPVADTNVRAVPCGVPNVCNQACPTFKRTLPFTATSVAPFRMAIRAVVGNGCIGGKYKLIIVSPAGTVPTLVGDDVDP